MLDRIVGSWHRTDMNDVMAMRLHVSLDGEDQAALVKVMAAMPSRDDSGRPIGISPQDAIRYALRLASKVRR